MMFRYIYFVIFSFYTLYNIKQRNLYDQFRISEVL
jgi:hypothetical protein